MKSAGDNAVVIAPNWFPRKENLWTAEGLRMIIKCTFLLSRESGMDGRKQSSDDQPLPEGIIKKGTYLNNAKGAFRQVIIIYKFDKSHFTRAWEYIARQLDAFRDLPGFTLSAHIYGPRPCHLSLERGEAYQRISEVLPW